MKRLSRILSILAFLLLLSLSATAQEEKSATDPILRDVIQIPPVQTASLAAPLPEVAALPKPDEQNSPVITPYHENPAASQAVERSISLFSNKIRDRFALYLSRSGRYLDIMKDILRKKDVPEDIVFLSLIE
ncbi:MAG TPA: hypothetical protein VEP69_01890, partial [Thermodesulfovibrionales bacterium]|nr:hypothetical protein [Thermodesulfovibrionales bacterium]